LHWPSQYDVAPVQTTPQPPQLFGSLYALTHWAPQHVNPGPQAGLQAPPLDPPDELPLELPELALPDEPPELLALEPPLLPPTPSVEASSGAGEVAPPHSDARIATTPNRPMPRGHFEGTCMVPPLRSIHSMPLHCATGVGPGTCSAEELEIA
jgi:hypothetical protein